MHVALMVEVVLAKHPWMTKAWIARQVGIARPHLVAYLNGRGHVGKNGLRRLRKWCVRLL